MMISEMHDVVTIHTCLSDSKILGSYHVWFNLGWWWVQKASYGGFQTNSVFPNSLGYQTAPKGFTMVG